MKIVVSPKPLPTGDGIRPMGNCCSGIEINIGDSK